MNMTNDRPGEVPHACREAWRLHKRHGLPFPLNVSHLLDAIETHKIFDLSSHTYNSSHAQNPREMLHPKKAWTIYNEHLDAYLIVWNPALSRASIRFSVAHEVGHILLNHERAWPTDSPLGKRGKECEANTFAKCLLAPFDAIHRVFEQKPFSAKMVAACFDIPYSVATGMRHGYEAWLQAQQKALQPR